MTAPADGNPGAAGTKAVPGSLPSPLDSVDDMRSAARWMTPATFRSARELEDLRKIINAEPGEFLGVAAPRPDGTVPDNPEERNDPVDQIFARQEALRQNAASLVRQAAAEKDPQRRELYRTQLRRVEENGERIGTYARYVLALGHAWRIKAALQQARIATLAGAGLVVIGATLFFSAAP